MLFENTNYQWDVTSIAIIDISQLQILEIRKQPGKPCNQRKPTPIRLRT
ncbi:hypothetical protein H1R20_g5173, partial [Candolleomyces eurysporus]